MGERQIPLLHTPPPFCQYASGPCDQDFGGLRSAQGLFLFASKPTQIAATIETAARELAEETGNSWRTWHDLDVGGRVIFCEICKAIRGATTVYADVTTLNFNLLFEIGFCIGLGMSVQPIRDATYSPDRRTFDGLGLLDTVGYLDFTNVGQLKARVLGSGSDASLGRLPQKSYTDTPLYVIKSSIETEGSIRILSALKKSPLRFRTYDPVETPRLSLHTAHKQVAGSFGVVADLLSPHREGALVHNARCALLAGIALAHQKAVLMLQEEGAEQPIDYRDLVASYETPDQAASILTPFVTEVIKRLQAHGPVLGASPSGVLDRLDLGDVAAENEIEGLRDYFVQTGQFRQAMQGHARLVVGRKGAGKTALFYAIRRAAARGQATLVLDMKPEGHQFTRLREAILEELSEGQQEYTITAFWTYLLSAEIAHKLLNSRREMLAAERDPERFARYKRLEDAYLSHGLASGDDLSQRLLRQVDRLAERFGAAGQIGIRTDLAELVYGGDIRTLNDSVASYLVEEKEEVWLLIDNLDKSWATRGATAEDMLIVRGLLEASRQLQRQLERRSVTLRPIVFVRTDIYAHLVRETPDRGKDSAIYLDWDDPELFREIVKRRIVRSTDIRGSFEEVWRHVASVHVGAEDAFGYMLDRTLMRPRDVLMFLQRAVEVAINRGHQTIHAQDIQQAENSYSEDLFLGLIYEIDDTRPELSDSLYAFQGIEKTASHSVVRERLISAGVAEKQIDDAVELLLWFGFLGIEMNATGEEKYAYGARFNVKRLTQPVRQNLALYVIHPAFRAALGISQP